MDTGLLHTGLVNLEPGAVLRLRDPAGRHIGVVRGAVWLTQDNDRRDRVLADGDSFRFDRDGLALVMALGEAASVVLEDGLAPQGGNAALEHERRPAAARASAFVDRARIEATARRLRAEAMAQMLAGFGRALRAAIQALRVPIQALRAVGRILRAKGSGFAGSVAAVLRARRTAHALEGLSDHILKDVGLRRDQIEWAAGRTGAGRRT